MQMEDPLRVRLRDATGAELNRLCGHLDLEPLSLRDFPLDAGRHESLCKDKDDMETLSSRGVILNEKTQKANEIHREYLSAAQNTLKEIARSLFKSNTPTYLDILRLVYRGDAILFRIN